MPVDLATAKRHLIVEHDDDDTLIQSQIDAAETYVTSIGVAADAGAARDQAVLLLISDFYDGRNGSEENPRTENAHAVAALLAPLRSHLR